ncbi:MAG: 30S ribosomal protein S6 [Chloroflexi bacterium]|nr:30S ribosomal protein S6 [Chloroflexota bacterium]
MRDYELMMVLSPEVDEEASAALLERVGQVISDRGGSVTHQEPWGTRRLAYPINEFREGSYVLTHLTLEPDAIGGLDAHLKSVSDVIRYLLVKRDTKTSEEKR